MNERKHAEAAILVDNFSPEKYCAYLLEFVVEHEDVAAFVKAYYHDWLVTHIAKDLPELNCYKGED